MAEKKKYTAADIEVLEGLEPVRKRPGMYIAGTDTPEGLHQLIFEIVDNSVDEAMNGHADRIEVTLHSDRKQATVSDNGRGIPVEPHPKFKRPALELIFTTLHAGGKFSSKNYQTAGGLHGVGSSVVNALSEELTVTVKRDGNEYEQRFARGAVKSKLKRTKSSVRGTGTTVTFRPDPTIFGRVEFSADVIRKTLQTKAYLNPGLRVLFRDQSANTEDEFHYADGLHAYLKQLLVERELKPIGGESFFMERREGLEIALALAWTEQRREEFLSFANGIYTSDGGSHELAAKSGIVKAIRQYLTVHQLLPKGVKVTSEDIREGCICLLSVKIPNEGFQIQFQGQTKSKLNNPEIMPAVESALRALEQLFNEKPTVSAAIVNRIVLAAKARLASRAAVESVTRKVGISHRLTLPGKLADCSSIRPAETELFIVEGDSAGGSAKQARNRHFQAVLPLRGKVLNTISASGKQVLENKELSSIISALGCGAGEQFRADRLRYGKVIILTDADADGMHIATLLIAFFFTHLRQLIENGNLYLGKPPLYGVFSSKNETQAKANTHAGEKKTKGKRARGQSRNGASPGVSWVYSDEELSRTVANLRSTNPRIVRFKGLGEMNPETLWSTTLDPDTRTILRITIDDEGKVNDGLRALMGNDASERFRLIQEHASGLELDL